jgi:hypothetical protein
MDREQVIATLRKVHTAISFLMSFRNLSRSLLLRRALKGLISITA